MGSSLAIYISVWEKRILELKHIKYKSTFFNLSFIKSIHVFFSLWFFLSLTCSYTIVSCYRDKCSLNLAIPCMVESSSNISSSFLFFFSQNHNQQWRKEPARQVLLPQTKQHEIHIELETSGIKRVLYLAYLDVCIWKQVSFKC